MFFPLLTTLLISLVFKLILIFTGAVPFNSDEAIVALAARHILQGARPVFYYGQAYMGTVDSFLVALAFSLFGESVWVMRFVQVGVYLLFTLSIWALTNRLFNNRSMANTAAFLAAIPPVMITTYTTPYFGTYGETLVFGNILLLVGFEIIYGKWQRSIIAWIGLGVIAGFAFWTFSMIGIYVLPVAMLGLWEHRLKLWRQYLVCAAAFLIGSSPWWWFNLHNDWAAWFALVNPSLIQVSFFERLIGFLGLGIPALLSIRPPWQALYFSGPILFVGGGLYLIAVLEVGRAAYKKTLPVSREVLSFLILYLGIYLGIFLGTNLGIDSTGRYLLPLFILLVMFIAYFIETIKQQRARVAYIVTIAFMLVNLSGTWLAAQSEDGITTQFDPITSFNNQNDQALIDFLIGNDLTRGYTNYWVTYRLAFLSSETLVYSPELPYKQNLTYTPADIRIPEYASLADDSPESTWITSKHPQLDAILRDRFFELGITFKEKQIGPYHLFYEFSQRVSPEDVGYGSE